MRCVEARVLVGCAMVLPAQRRSFLPPDPDRARQGIVRLGVIMKGSKNVPARFGAFTERKGRIATPALGRLDHRRSP